MSWLHLNDSLNSIKGQISNFASGVLADGTDNSESKELNDAKKKIEELQNICANLEMEILSLRSHAKGGSNQPKQSIDASGQPGSNSTASNWSWEPSDSQNEPQNKNNYEKIISNLKMQIEILETEKKDLTNSLDQLDLDCQQTTDKLVTLKDKLQVEYNNLKENYEAMKQEYGNVMNENLEKQKILDSVRNDYINLKVTYDSFSQKMAVDKNQDELCLQKELELLNHENNNKLKDLKRDYQILADEFERYKLSTQEIRILEHNQNEEIVEQLEDTCRNVQEENQHFLQNLQAFTELQQNYKKLKKEYDVNLRNEIDCVNFQTENEKLLKKVELLENDLKEMEKYKSSQLELCNIKEKYENLLEQKNEAGNESTDITLTLKQNKADIPILGSNKDDQNDEFRRLRGDYVLLNEKYDKIFEEKSGLHKKYLTLLSENLRKFVDNELPPESSILGQNFSNNDLEFNEKIQSIIKVLMDYKWKCEALEKELYEVNQGKNKAVSEKNYEIEKLLQNSEILSQEVISKTQALKDYEDECAELMKNNDLLIAELQGYKNNSGLQTISESNEDNMLLLESQLENANKRIMDLEVMIADIESSKQDVNLETQTELDYIKKQLNMTGQELSRSKDEYNELALKYQQLDSGNILLQSEIKNIQAKYDSCCKEKWELKANIDKLRFDYENAEYKFTEVNVNMETYKEELETYKKEIDKLNRINKKLELLKVDAEGKTELLETDIGDLKQQLNLEMEKVQQQESHIRNLTEKLQNFKMSETTLKLQLQTVTEVKQHLESKYNQLQSTLKTVEDNLDASLKENNNIREKLMVLEEAQNHGQNLVGGSGGMRLPLQQNDKIITLLKNDLEPANQSMTTNDMSPVNLQCEEAVKFELENQLSELKSNLDTSAHEKLQIDLNSTKAELEKVVLSNQELVQKITYLEIQFNELINSRNELITSLTSKNHENVQYYHEIQRLNKILSAEIEKCHKLELRFDTVSESGKEVARMKAELEEQIAVVEKLSDQNAFLREKSEILAQNLLQEQSYVQKILAERSGVNERELASNRELERLRNHLLEMETAYTQELVQAESRNQEMLAKVNEIEQREKNSSSLYTSVSIRANQQVETLQTQLQLVTNQRDELRKKISDAEDQHNKQAAALTNLQLVLEQFQKDKEKDVFQETERIRKQILAEKQIQQDLLNEISILKSQLEESKQGLQAASRLANQLEYAKQQITAMKDEVAQVHEKLRRSDEKNKELASHTDSKVDKSLIKNLVIGFVSSHANTNLTRNQNQILKIIATVLDFNQQETEKVKLNKLQQESWLGSLLQPQSLTPGQGMSQQSLSEAFVRFLENESKPKILPNLLNTKQVEKVGPSSSATPRNSPLLLSEVVLPTFADFGQNRNSSSILKDVLKDNS